MLYYFDLVFVLYHFEFELMRCLLKIFDDLGLKEGNGLYLLNDNDWKKECNFSSRVNRLIEGKIKPDAFFVFGNKPLMLFYENPSDKLAIHKAIWNFNESPIVFIVEDDNLEIFNGFNFLKDKDSLERIGSYEKLDDFNYFKLVTGSTWEDYQAELDKKKRVDYHLLENIKAARRLLQDIIDDDSFRIVNALIGKIIFIRYLIDRGVKIGFKNEESRYWTTDDLIAILSRRDQAIDFFKHLQFKFNGDMFPLEDTDYELITQECLSIIIRLLNEEDLGNGQMSLFKLYDFSIIPIEFVSNVYESFIGEKNQEKEGAYYTPLFLVDYILSETVQKHFENKYIYNCRVLDPACGSGIFLVETLRKIIEQFIEIHPAIANNPVLFKKVLPTLAKNNIFGVDKNLAAIQVAIFSIQLTLLDYQEPSDIETFRCPPLLDTNFFESDFFEMDEEKPLNKVVGKLAFRFILGNPPWKRGKGDEKKPLFDEYIKLRKKKEKEQRKEGTEIAISNKEIAQAFLLRVSDFSTEDTECGLIATSKVLYNLNAKDFRAYFLENYTIRKVFELAPVRREVFNRSENDRATGPAVILFYKDSQRKDTDNNLINHIALKPSRFFSIFKIFTLNRTDFKKVEQKSLKDFDWLWKTLVYGTYLDFELIRRLKNNYSKISDIIYNGNDFLVKQGLKRKDGNKKIDAKELKGWDFLEIGDKRKELEQFFIMPDHRKWDQDFVGYIYRENGKIVEDVFLPNTLLIKETVNTKLESIAAISTSRLLFTDKVTSIRKIGSVDNEFYRKIAGLLSSELFSYFILQVASTTGVMIEQQIHDIERFEFLFLENLNIENLVVEIETAKLALYLEKHKFPVDDSKINYYSNLIKNINKEINTKIYNEANINDIERTVIDYSTSVVIPWIMKHKQSQKLFDTCPESFLSSYAQVFLDRFTPTLNKNDKKFIVEIWHSRHIIGMLFKVVPDDDDHKDNVVWLDKGNDLIMQKMISLGANKITDRLFVQKDIRGFEKDFFYVFKPNEKRLWHKAIAYLDADEFMDAILKAGRRGE
jgi:hypothetical protein